MDEKSDQEPLWVDDDEPATNDFSNEDEENKDESNSKALIKRFDISDGNSQRCLLFNDDDDEDEIFTRNFSIVSIWVY